MINPNMLCMRCMSQLTKENGFCPNCGFDNRVPANELHQLECRSILAGAYLIGCVLGQGGFGITYTAWDLNLDIKVAIKEYYPLGYAARDSHTHVSVLTLGGDKREFYQKGLERFVNEAKTLARLTKDRGIVGVRGFLRENGTAYIVMDYVEGETLKNIAAKQGGRLPGQLVLGLFRPLCASLARVHAEGLLHRDISPDNIILQPDGVLTLIDFGAARQISADGEHSNTINVKHGFAPEEQYRTHGEQGPWTDVYALCATMYRLMTGQTPPQALDRLGSGAEIAPPRQLGADITPEQERALLHGLHINAQNRIQDMQGLIWELYGNATPSQKTAADEEKKAPIIKPFIKQGSAPNPFAQKAKTRTKGSWKPIGIVTGSAIGLYLLILIGIGAFRGDAKAQEPKGENLAAAVITQTPVDVKTPAPTATPQPTPEPFTAEAAVEIYLDYGETYQCTTEDFDLPYAVADDEVNWLCEDNDAGTLCSSRGRITAGNYQVDPEEKFNDALIVTGKTKNGSTLTYTVLTGRGDNYIFSWSTSPRTMKGYTSGYVIVSDEMVPQCSGFTIYYEYELTDGKLNSDRWSVWVREDGTTWVRVGDIFLENKVGKQFDIEFDHPITFNEICVQPETYSDDYSCTTSYAIGYLVFN